LESDSSHSGAPQDHPQPSSFGAVNRPGIRGGS